MKKVHELMAELKKLGIKLWDNNGRLGYHVPKGTLPPLLRAELVAQKNEILAFLRQINQKVELPSRFPLSYNQQALWFVYQEAPESSAYNITLPFEIRGELDISFLRQVIQQLMAHHPALRTFITVEAGIPFQEIQPIGEVAWTEYDITDWTEERLLAEAQLASQRPFDLTQAPTLRVDLFRGLGEQHILLLTQHHIFTDGRSINILLQDLFTLYKRESLPVSTASYADYVTWEAEWLASPAGLELAHYWQQKLAGEIPVLNLPLDYPRPLSQTYQGTTVHFSLPSTLSQQLKQVALQEKTTLFTVVMTAFQILLHRYSGQTEIWLGTPTAAGRLQNQFAHLVGYLVNPVVIRATVDPSNNYSFKQLLAQTRQTVIEALNHQGYPFPLVVKLLQPQRETSYSPLFQVMFSFENSQLIDMSRQSDTIGLSSLPLNEQEGQFDLTLTIREYEKLTGQFTYRSDLFKPETIERMAGHLQTLLAAIVANPDQPIATLPMLTATERQQILIEWNDTATDYPQDKCIHQLFEEQVERTPANIAVIFEQAQLTYQELNQRANQLAHYLQSLGVGSEVLVGICVERSIDMVVGLLGILKAGGAYVPLDQLTWWWDC